MKWPNFLERKQILFSPKTLREEAIRWGDRYMELQRLHDAVAFYGRAQHNDGLRLILGMAVESGDFLLFREAVGGMSPPVEEHKPLSRLAERAAELGRWHDARKAYERLGDEKGVRRAMEALAALMGNSPPAAAPEGSEHGG